jgi:DNA-binding beta-propeller fold protein YncE
MLPSHLIRLTLLALVTITGAASPSGAETEGGPLLVWPTASERSGGLARATRDYQTGHSLFDAAFDLSGKRIVTGAADGIVQVRDFESGEILEQWSQGSAISSVAFTPDGLQVMTTSDDRQAVLRDVKDGSMNRVWRHQSPVNGAALTPDGRSLVTASADRQMARFSLSTGRKELDWVGDGTVFDVAFGPDGRKILTGTREHRVVWRDLETDRILLEGQHEDAVWSVAVSPDGSRLVSGSADHRVILRHARTNDVLQTWTLPSAVLTVAFSPDGKRLAAGSSEGHVWLLDPGTGETIQRWTAAAPVRAVAFSPDGASLLSASEDGHLAIRRLPLDAKAFVQAFSTRCQEALERLRARPGWMDTERSRLDRERPAPPTLVYGDDESPDAFTARVARERDAYDVAILAHSRRLQAHAERVAAWERDRPNRLPPQEALAIARSLLDAGYGAPEVTNVREVAGDVIGSLGPSELGGLGMPTCVVLVGPDARSAVGKTFTATLTLALDKEGALVWQRAQATTGGKSFLLDPVVSR